MTRRLLFSVAFLGLIAVLTRWTGWMDAVESRASYEFAWLTLGAVGLMTGLFEGRWWVLTLPFVTWVVVWVPGLDGLARAYFLFFGVPVLFVGLLLGVLVRARPRAVERANAAELKRRGQAPR